MMIRIRQRDITDCGPACLASVFRYYGKDYALAAIRQKAGTDKKGTNILGMIEAAQSFGFEAKGVKGPIESLPDIPLPAIAHLVIRETLQHFVVISKVRRNYIEIMDPAEGKLCKKKPGEFKNEWSGVLILLLPLGNELIVNNLRQSVRRRFIVLLKPHSKLLFQALFGAVIYTVLGLSTSIFIQKLVDFVLIDSNYKLLNLMSMGMILLLVLRVFIGLIKGMLVLRTGQMIDARLILGYYKHLMSLPQQFFDSMRVGEITSRIGDAVKIRVFINDVSISLLVNIFMLLSAFGLMFTYYWKLALIVLLIVPLYSVIYLITDHINKKVQRRMMEESAELEAQLVESLNAAGTIKRFGLEDHANMKTEVRFVRLLKTVYRSGLNSLFSGSSTDFVSQLFTILLLWTGAGFVINGRISPGELLSFYTLIGYFTSPVASIIGLNKVVQDAVIAAGRLFEIMDLDQEDSPEERNQIVLSADNMGDIRFEALTFRYGTRTTVFENLNLHISKGIMTGIVGESGSGKSTLLALLQDIYPANGGQILIGKYPLKYISRQSLRKIIGVVPQQTDLFLGSVADNIALGEDRADMGKMLMICERLGILQFIERLPAGFETNLGENGVSLSGGQRQRLAIARALYRDPEILVLDEATSSLDPIAEKHVQDTLRYFLQQGKTVVVIAHRLNTIRYADQIIVLKDGKVKEEGTHEHLLSLRSEYYYLWTQNMPGVADFSKINSDETSGTDRPAQQIT